ncbi:MAG: glycine--tRNA ligase subunit beta [Altererythrobacter sp.]|nr:glycine--tRNA ligase subunit beta [Altererythrobacter sp.]
MSDFLLELRCEEIPARMQAGARAELGKLLRRELAAAGIDAGDVTVWSTPRRLALIAKGLPDATEAVSEEAKGPPEGAPDAALEGFCRKNGVTKDQLQLRDVKGRPTWFAIIDKPGRATRDVLAEAIPAVVRDFAWPKSMRWGEASLSTESPRWVRPLSGIVAILGEDLVECEAAGVASGFATLGHRFHHSGPVTIGGAHDYAEKLRACHVIVDHEERAALIREGAARAAGDAGLALVEDEGLVVENAGLTEWPLPLLGRFDEAFLDVPPEVIQLTARVNQKYFVANDGAGKLANAFVCTANIAADDGGAAIVEGNRKVLAARLSDARFFWEQDRKTTLAEHAKKLERITFHEKLGTVADKVERVAKLARWLVDEGIVVETPLPSGKAPGVGGATSRPSSTHPQPLPSREGASLADLAEQAARLAKADLVTEMVGEFPELQGVMGGYYARAEGLDPQVADAIRDHYKPMGQGDEVPTAPVTVAVSLADKLDTLAGFFMKGLKPTGSKDPFALRRASLGVLAVTIEGNLRGKLAIWLAEARNGFREQGIEDERPHLETQTVRAELQQQFARVFMADIREFIADRLKVQQREAGVRHDLIDAVFALGGEDDLVRLLARVKALQHYIETAEGADLLAAYKRAANILKKEGWASPTASTPLPEGEGPGVGVGGATPPPPQTHPQPIPSREGALNTQGIARTGEEDPLSMVDDPDMAAVIKAQLEEKKNKSLSYTPDDAEEALIAALDSAEPAAVRAVEAEDFAGAMSALATLRGPIDRFFEEVTVNDPNRDKRAARLGLLARFRDAVHRVADFGRIEG